jgi:sterol-4alpha-carboxylate 3-dehydrogenase (decarboxylating)
MTFANLDPQPKVIIHTSCPPSMEAPTKQHWAVNAEGTRYLLAATRSAGNIQAPVLCSSPGVTYCNVSDMIEADERPKIDPQKQPRIYLRTKEICEAEILAANRVEGSGCMLTSALRQCTTFGPDDPQFLGKIVDVCKTGKAKYRMGDGKNLFDFIYVGNAAHAHLHAAHELLEAYGRDLLPEGERVEGEVFNVSNDEHIPFRDFTFGVADRLGMPVPERNIVMIPQFVAITMGFFSEWFTWLTTFSKGVPNMTVSSTLYTFNTHTLNIRKAKRVLGYRSTWSLQKSMDLSLAWYKANEKKTR